MKFFVPFLALLLISCGSARTTDKLLAEVWQSDQDVRHQMWALTKAFEAEQRPELLDSMVVAVERMEAVDSRNMAIVDSLLQRGVPRGLTAQSYKTIWIVIDHAPLEKQVQYLPLVEQMAANGVVGRDEYAILFDRVLMGQNKPQRYGSQSVQFGEAGQLQLYLWPVESPDLLDSLRASVGLSPMSEYLQLLSDTTGSEVVFDPAITVEQLVAMRQRATTQACE